MFNLANYNITYSLELHPDLIAEIDVGGGGAITSLKADYARVVDETLQDPAGWRTHGYTFMLDSSGTPRTHTLKIILAPESTCMRAGITQGLSGYVYKSRHIR